MNLEENKDLIPITVKMRVKEEPVVVIIDTGAAVSIISESLRSKLNIPIWKEVKNSYSGISGKVRSLGQVITTIEYRDQFEVEAKLGVLRMNREYILLGNDILSKFKIEIDYKNKRITFEKGGERVEIPVEFMKEQELDLSSDEESDSEESLDEDSDEDFEDEDFKE